MTNLNLYKCFCVVADEKNISKASEKLFISQPAVSFAIKELEQSLNQKLFIRKSKGVLLTTFGEILYNKVKPALQVFDEAETSAEQFSLLQDGIVRIGSNSSNANQYLVKYLTEFVKAYPSMRVTMIRDNKEALLNKLKNNELDLIFIDKPNSLEQVKLIKEMNIKYQLVGNADYKAKFSTPTIDVERFPFDDLILPSRNNNSRLTIEKYFADSGKRLNPKYELDNYILLYEFVKNGLGIAFVNIEYYEDDIKSGRVSLIYPDFFINARTLACLVNDKTTNPALTKLIEIISRD